MFTSTHWLMKSRLRLPHQTVAWVHIPCRNQLALLTIIEVASKSRFAFKLNRACCHLSSRQERQTWDLLNIDPLRTSCRSILCSSSLVRVRRSRSVLSTTRMTIWKEKLIKKRPRGSEFNHLLACEQRTSDPVLSVTTDKREHVSVSSINDYATVILSTQAAVWNSKFHKTLLVTARTCYNFTYWYFL